MRLYYWIGFAASGALERSVVIAPDKADARAQLHAQGITPLVLRRPLLQSTRKLRQELTHLLSQLAWLLQAHVPLAQALAQLPHVSTQPLVKQLALQLEQRVMAGDSLAEAIRPLRSWLAPDYYAFIAAGEVTGRLRELLHEVCQRQAQQQQLMQRMRHALRYPLFLLLATFSMSVAMLLWIVPQYVAFLSDMHTSLPPLTSWLVQMTQRLHRSGHYFLVSFGILVAGCSYWRKHSRLIQAWHTLVLRTPIIGRLLQQLDLYRWCTLMAACSQTDLPLLERLSLAQHALQNRVLQQRVAPVAAAILQGLPLHCGLQQSHCFTDYDLALILLGEQSATLTQVFDSLATHYQRTVLNTLQTLTAWLEPCLLLCLGGGTAVMILAFYQPMIHLGLHL